MCYFLRTVQVRFCFVSRIINKDSFNSFFSTLSPYGTQISRLAYLSRMKNICLIIFLAALYVITCSENSPIFSSSQRTSSSASSSESWSSECQFGFFDRCLYLIDYYCMTSFFSCCDTCDVEVESTGCCCSTLFNMDGSEIVESDDQYYINDSGRKTKL